MKPFLLLLALLASPLMGVADLSREITPESVLREMNEQRLAEKLGPLRLDERLNQAAEDRMRDMEEMSYWSHRSPEGLSPFVWMKPRGYEFAFAGENLAAGFETVTILVDSWMESDGHRRNILSPDFDEVGVAVIDGRTTGRGNGRSIVVLFARERFSSIR